MSLYCSNAGSYLLKQIEKIRPGVTNSSTQCQNLTICSTGYRKKNCTHQLSVEHWRATIRYTLHTNALAPTWDRAIDPAQQTPRVRFCFARRKFLDQTCARIEDLTLDRPRSSFVPATQQSSRNYACPTVPSP